VSGRTLSLILPASQRLSCPFFWLSTAASGKLSTLYRLDIIDLNHTHFNSPILSVQLYVPFPRALNSMEVVKIYIDRI